MVTTDKDYNAVIAAAPLMALVAVAACLSFYLFTHRAYWAAGRRWRQGAVPSTLGLSLSFEPLRESDPVHELRWVGWSGQMGLQSELGAALVISARGVSSLRLQRQSG